MDGSCLTYAALCSLSLWEKESPQDSRKPKFNHSHQWPLLYIMEAATPGDSEATYQLAMLGWPWNPRAQLPIYRCLSLDHYERIGPGLDSQFSTQKTTLSVKTDWKDNSLAYMISLFLKVQLRKQRPKWMMKTLKYVNLLLFRESYFELRNSLCCRC